MINFELNTQYNFIFRGKLHNNISYNIILSITYGSKADFIIDYITTAEFLIELISTKELVYEIDEEHVAHFALAKFPCEFLDANEILVFLFCSEFVKLNNVNIDVQIAGETKFTGSVDPLSIVFNKNDLILSCSFKPNTYILNETDTWLNNAINYIPIGINLNNTPVLLTEFVSRVYKIVQNNIVLNSFNNWSFLAVDESSTPPLISIENINALYVDERLFGNYNNNNFIDNGINNYGDLIKQLALTFGCITGMVSNKDAIFVPFLDENKPSITIDEKSIINIKIEGNRDIISFLVFNPGGNYLGTPTNITGKYLTKEIFTSFFINTPSGFLPVSKIKVKNIWENISTGVLNYWSKYFMSKKYIFSYTFELAGIDYNLWEDIIVNNVKYTPVYVKINFEEYKTEIKAIRIEEQS
ncbi:MAG: hypothetical protein V1773_01075 [bacterium]